MILDEHDPTRVQVGPDAAHGVRQDQHLGAQPPSHPDRRGHGIGLRPFVEVHPPRLHEHLDPTDAPEHEAAVVALHGSAHEAGEPAEGHARGIGDHPLHLAQTAPEHEVDRGVHSPFLAEDPRPLANAPRPARAARQISTPAIAAVMNAAIDPPIMALRPSRARSSRRDGAIPPIPPIWTAIEAKLANPERA